MEESVRRIQERLRKTLNQVVSCGDEFDGFPLLVLDEAVTAAVSAEDLAKAMAQQLRERGYKAAIVKRYTVNNAHHFERGSLGAFNDSADQVVVGLPNGIVSVVAAEEPSVLDLVRAVDPSTDIILGLNFGYLPIPRILVTDRPQEAFNLGLPRVIGYVSSKDARAIIPRFESNDIEGLVDLAICRIIRSADEPADQPECQPICQLASEPHMDGTQAPIQA